MVFEVCALVLTVILSLLGIYLFVVLRSVRKLSEEARQSFVSLNEELPVILADLKDSVYGLKTTTQTVQDKVENVTSNVKRITSGPIITAAEVVGTLRNGIAVWRQLRRKGA